MADDAPKHDPMSDVWFIVGLVAVLVFLWYMSGGPGRADLRGIFLAPPPPVGSGEAYGPAPDLGTSTEQFQTGSVPAPQPINY